MAKKEELHCSFCGRSKSQTQILIAGVESHICESCIRQAHGIVTEELERKTEVAKGKQLNLLKPREIKEFTDQYVIGQDDAKKTLAVAVYNHYKRLNQKAQDDVEIEKSNIVLVGRTGTGKTLLARTIARLLNVPFTIVDATVLTESGYVGEDVESILTRLLQAAEYDVAAAERGVVFIDEIDKIARKGDNPSITRDVSGEGVQQGLLKLLEGSKVNVPPQGGRKHPEQKFVEIDTRNILFIAGGAFDGIEKVIARRLNTASVGYTSAHGKRKINTENFLQYISPQDLKSFGLIPELIGRMPVVSYLNPLDGEALRRILTEPKNALIKQFTSLFALDGIQLEVTEDALQVLVDKAVEYKLGARGLRSILEAVLTDAMFELPGTDATHLTVDALYVNSKLARVDLEQLKAAS